MTLESLQFSPGAYLAPSVDWLNANFHPVFDLVTRAIEALLSAIEYGLVTLPSYAVIAIATILAGIFVSPGIGIMTAVALGFCLAAGLWTASMQTVALVTVSVAISVAIAFPLGILAARHTRLEAALRPVLDIMQTLPIFVYLIPFVMLFGPGKIPAILATVFFAIPPVIRLTDLGIRQVDGEVVEAIVAFGATPGQKLVKVQIPLALPTIMAGINQTTMMALSMVVIASMIGAGGLGYQVLQGIQRLEVSRGLLSGIAIVFLAVIFDRIAQSYGRRAQKHLATGE